MKTLCVVILILFSFFLIWYYLFTRPRVCSRFYHPYCRIEDIPKFLDTTQSTDVIWSYWHEESIPASVEFCFQTWVHYNPNYTICLLSNKNLSNFISNVPPSKTHQEHADKIRIMLLERYGGIWIDSTIILQSPLDPLFGKKDYDVGGFWIQQFTTDNEHKVFENWFISAPRNSPLIREWRKEFFNALSYETRAEYIKKIEDDGVDLQNISAKEYLMMHCCFLKVIRGKHSYRIYAFSVTDPQYGPFYYIDKYNWNSHVAVLNLLRKDDETVKQPIIKLRGDERKYFDGMFFICSDSSKIGKLKKQVNFHS